jgi:putative transposase
VQELSAQSHLPGYVEHQERVAEELGRSVRSVRRLLQQYREKGVSGIIGQPRKDKGHRKISVEWQKFILDTYREGNRDGRKLSPLQVSLRVKVRALDLGVKSHPGQMTVYRILRSEIEQSQRPKRSLGWQGSRLMIKTREGLELVIDHSNQVWQCDHSKVDVLLVDSSGMLLGRPWLTTVIDTYSRCIMGIHLGFDAPSADVVCLALRHAILPKQYPTAYGLQQP